MVPWGRAAQEVVPTTSEGDLGSRIQETAGAAPGYTDDRTCATCHRELFDSYQSIGMSHAFYRPRADRMIEDFTANHYYHEPSRRHYEMTFEKDRMTITRYQLDEGNQRVNVLEQEIDWILGSGSRARSYLYQTELGELFLAPISWYSQSQTWRMAPGYDQPDHKGFARAVSRDCMFCHNAFPDVPAGSDRHGEPAVFPAELPEGLGCQRCHGPGANHVRLAFDVAPVEIVAAAIVDPADLENDLRLDVCMQCHLQPSVAVSPIRRFERPDYSFRPGEALADYLVHLDPVEDRPRPERFEINHHAYRLRQSRCFLESQGALSCLTCHDPHRKVPAQEVAAHYRAACRECHTADGYEQQSKAHVDTATDNCVACHMQPQRTQDVVHAVMTDHLIRRTPAPDRERLDPIPETKPRLVDVEALAGYPNPPESDAEVYRAIALARAGSDSAIDRLRDAVAATRPEYPAPYLELVTAQLGGGRFEGALESLDWLSKIDPDHPTAALHRGVALASLGRRAEAEVEFERALALAPDRPEVRYNLGKFLAVEGRTEEARVHLEAAIELRPNLTAAWFDAGVLHANQGDFELAAKHFRRALVLDPDHQTARSYLDRLERLPAAGNADGRPASSR